jgi:hypothetical protein
LAIGDWDCRLGLAIGDWVMIGDWRCWPSPPSPKPKA